MLYNVLVGFVFAQLHYTTKRLLPFFFWMQPFLLFFYSAIFVRIDKLVFVGETLLVRENYNLAV